MHILQLFVSTGNGASEHGPPLGPPHPAGQAPRVGSVLTCDVGPGLAPAWLPQGAALHSNWDTTQNSVLFAVFWRIL
jgi:hypothetical protein